MDVETAGIDLAVGTAEVIAVAVAAVVAAIDVAVDIDKVVSKAAGLDYMSALTTNPVDWSTQVLVRERSDSIVEVGPLVEVETPAYSYRSQNRRPT